MVRSARAADLRDGVGHPAQVLKSALEGAAALVVIFCLRTDDASVGHVLCAGQVRFRGRGPCGTSAPACSGGTSCGGTLVDSALHSRVFGIRKPSVF